MVKSVCLSVLVVTLSACASSRHAVTNSDGSQYANNGVVDYIWEEPMVDVVDVPPGLDPEGTYYRPAHKAVVEIRQGRWQHYK